MPKIKVVGMTKLKKKLKDNVTMNDVKRVVLHNGQEMQQKIVENAEITNDTIAISLYEENDKDSNIVCAKAADELLTISDITASFVIGKLGDKICISGRSIGDINVQIILEKLGGGGHITLAGAQVEGMTIQEVKQELIIRINEYFKEISN